MLVDVDVLQLGVELGVFGAGDQLDMARLLNTEVTAARLLDAALNLKARKEAA